MLERKCHMFSVGKCQQKVLTHVGKTLEWEKFKVGDLGFHLCVSRVSHKNVAHCAYNAVIS